MSDIFDMWDSESRFSVASGDALPYVVLQVTLKEKFFGTGSGNLTDLEDVINRQVAKGYRLHTMATSNGGSKGLAGGDRIQATLVFERLDITNTIFRPMQEKESAAAAAPLYTQDRPTETEHGRRTFMVDSSSALGAFYTSIENVDSSVEIGRIWKNSGLDSCPELHSLSEQIDKAVTIERYYGRSQEYVQQIRRSVLDMLATEK